MKVHQTPNGHRLSGEGGDVELANCYLHHLCVRGFSPATVRTYAFHLLSFLRFEEEQGVALATTKPTDLYDFIEWLGTRRRSDGVVVPISARSGVSPSTMNQKIAAVRGLFEYSVVSGARASSPVPSAKRATGLATRPRGLLGHLSTTRRRGGGGHLVKEPRRLPESLEPDDVSAFLADLNTHRDRAMTLAMVLGGLRSAEVRSLLLSDVDMGARRVRVVGKGSRERVVPIDRPFFSELAAYLRTERPVGCPTPECFVVLRGPTEGGRLSEAGLRRIFRTHRATSGALRVRPHRLRHTYGTDLATAGLDLLVLRELMGHVSPETTARYVHLSPQTLADEYHRARSAR
jgi:site-specific recombinase XerD